MSFLSKLRKEWGYETSVARCCNCVHYRKPGSFLKNSQPTEHPPMCKLGMFMTRPNACCDKWVDAGADAVRKPGVGY